MADVAGRVRLEGTTFFKKQTSAVDQNLGSFVFELETKHALTDQIRFRFEPRFHFSSDPKIVDAPADGDLRDTQFEGKVSSLRLQLGSLVKVWEGTDGLNPMDLTSMKNLRDPLAQESLGSLGVSLAGGEGFLTWDLLYVPQQTPSRLLGETSPWWPRSHILPIQRENQELRLPEEPEYRLLPRESFGHSLENNGGLRVQLHGGSWDFSLAGFEGAAQTPLLQPVILGNAIEVKPRLVVQMDNPIQLRPIDYRRRSVAGALVWTHESWIVRLAGRHDQPIQGDLTVPEWMAGSGLTTQDLLPSWSSQGILGLEKTVAIHDQSVIFVLQVAYGVNPESGGVFSSQDLFQRAVLYGFRWPWSDVTTFNYSGFYEFKKNSSYGRLQWQRKITDPTLVEVSLDFFKGPPESLLGVWSNQSRGILAFVYQF